MLPILVTVAHIKLFAVSNVNPIQNAQLTKEFAALCKKYYVENIKGQMEHRNRNLYVEYYCMVPPSGRTGRRKKGWFGSYYQDETNLANNGHPVSIAFIRNPFHHDEYLPLNPVLDILQEVWNDMGVRYTVSFEHLVLNAWYWEEDNSVLRFHVVQGG